MCSNRFLQRYAVLRKTFRGKRQEEWEEWEGQEKYDVEWTLGYPKPLTTTLSHLCQSHEIDAIVTNSSPALAATQLIPILVQHLYQLSARVERQNDDFQLVRVITCIHTVNTYDYVPGCLWIHNFCLTRAFMHV